MLEFLKAKKRVILCVVAAFVAAVILALTCLSIIQAVKINSANNDILKLKQANAELTDKNNTYAQSESEYQNQIAQKDQKISDLTNRVGELQQQIIVQNSSAAPQWALSKITEAEKLRLENHNLIFGGQKVCFLTFDDGPCGYTPQVLQVLDEHDVKATFFVTDKGSSNVYMRDIVEQGHAIGIHTASHKYEEIYKSDTAFFDDLNRISRIITEQTGITTKIMRFPGGSSNLMSKRYNNGIMSRLAVRVTDMGYQYFDWNVDSSDASASNVPPEQIRDAVLSAADSKDSICVLMHDIKKSTLEALPEIIAGLKSKGFIFLKLNEQNFGFHHGINN